MVSEIRVGGDAPLSENSRHGVEAFLAASPLAARELSVESRWETSFLRSAACFTRS